MGFRPFGGPSIPASMQRLGRPACTNKPSPRCANTSAHAAERVLAAREVRPLTFIRGQVEELEQLRLTWREGEKGVNDRRVDLGGRPLLLDDAGSDAPASRPGRSAPRAVVWRRIEKQHRCARAGLRLGRMRPRMAALQEPGNSPVPRSPWYPAPLPA